MNKHCDGGHKDSITNIAFQVKELIMKQTKNIEVILDMYPVKQLILRSF